jgi:fucose 4-O-acetylase-like acetyltransferase
LPFYYLGHLYKQYQSQILRYKHWGILMSVVVIVVAIISQMNGWINYQLDMKYQVYNHLGLDIIIPLSFTIVLITLSKIVANIARVNDALRTLGSSSLTIMYFHLVILLVVPEILSLPTYVNVVLAIILPVVFHKVVQSITPLKFLLLGHRVKSRHKKPSYSQG